MKIAASIFKTFFLSLCIIANTHLAFAQTASILPQGKTQFLDNNGKPLTSGTIDFYTGNVSSTTRKTTWQNSGETIANTNPVILDAGGRAIIYGDGVYRQVVKDRLNNIIWDQLTSSTGSGSGGGSAATGDGDLVGTIKPWAGMTAPNQYVFTYGQEISRTTFAVTFAAITSAQAVFCTSGSPILSGLSDTTNFPIGAPVEVSCLASGFSTIISKTSSSITLAVNANVSVNATAVIFPWGNGNHVTTFNVPDFRGVPIAGNNNMGGVASSNATIAFWGQNPNGVGVLAGSQSATLNLTQIPAGITSANTGVINLNVTSTDNNVAVGAGATAGPGGATLGVANFKSENSTGTIGIGVIQSTSNNTNGLPFSIIQPIKTSNYIIKIIPDSNSAIASGVTSLGGMIGDIACGTGLLCTGNTVSVNFVTVNTDNVLYTAPYTGAIAISQTLANSQSITSASSFCSDTTGTVDCTTQLQAALNAVPYGKALYLPYPYLISSTITRNTPIEIFGNTETGAGIIASSSFPTTSDILSITPASSTTGWRIHDFQISGQGGARGRHAIAINTTTSGASAYDFNIQRMLIQATATGQSIKVNNTQASGGVFTSAFDNNNLESIYLSLIGDTISIRNNSFASQLVSGNASIYVSQITGAGNVQIVGNNGSGLNGIVIIDSGIAPILRDNEFESLSGVNVYASMVDIRGSIASVWAPQLENNQIQIVSGTTGAALVPVTFGVTTNGTINGGRLSRPTAGNHIVNSASAVATTIGANIQAVIGATPQATPTVLESGLPLYGQLATSFLGNAGAVPYYNTSGRLVSSLSLSTGQAILATTNGSPQGSNVGVDGQLFLARTGNYPFFASMSQDCTINNTGVTTCLKTNNVAFGALATVTPGTGIAAALAISVGSAGAPVLFNGAGGTPTSLVGTNITALNATNLASGTVAAARGGAGTITGALKGSGAGVVTQAACADISNASVYCSATQGQLPGTTTNNNATAGNIGEYVESIVASGSAVALTNNTPINITSISLTAGDWDVSSTFGFTPAATTNSTYVAGSISLTTGTLDTSAGRLVQIVTPAFVSGGASTTIATSPLRFSLASTTTVFMVAQSGFTVSTNASYGIIHARRVR